MIELSTLRRFWWAIPMAALTIGLMVVLLVLEARTDDRDRWRTQAGDEKRAHEQTVANYRAASAEAQRQAAANVERVKAEQTKITERTVNDYQARLADVDARYERVRRQIAAQAYSSSTDLAPVSVTSAATCRAYGGTDCDTLLARLKAAERQAEQLIGLQDWVRQQAAVQMDRVTDPN
ncbi:hypothetical protein BV98_001429 [Sphingobium herbicidovorans NBRC 16415]|uniref:Endopeptidase n=1 Tax=Sphingobium herbicidovorans (strain ATCC 700291 / DSM 11019 / CCUG 56400 / KCTC 2939 / LMG 18315 / NBRC 16415 / MH) TaxID=1219045 RepID=A0A086PBE9_SPHHM|nr:hypothetical protein [Sphingobium herbicidovorans]KFG90717.1 hypothetical protein BV98_001429 [Sphingobium herbicidovorans NBRC 16415]